MTIVDTRPANEPSRLHFSARWDRNLVTADGGNAHLLVTISSIALPDEATKRTPVDLAFVLDRSGSMSGGKLELVKEATLMAVSMLDSDDRAALVIYDHEVETIHDLSYLDKRSKARLQRVLKPVETRGSTNLSDGWLAGCNQLAESMNGGRTRIRRAILLTDGQANMGITDPGQLMTHAGELRKRGIATTTIGVGEGFDEVFLSGMAEAGGGAFTYIRQASELRAFFQEELGTLLAVVATRLNLRLTLPHGVRAELVNFFPVTRTGKRIDVAIGDQSAGVDLNLVFAITVKPGLAGDSHPIALSARWTDPATERTATERLQVAPLHLVDRHDVERADIDPEVAEEVAIQIGSAREREAMRLDREGRRQESRDLLAQNADMLNAAPRSARVTAMHSHVAMLAVQDLDMEFSENVRKQSTSDASRRSRGRHKEPDTTPN